MEPSTNLDNKPINQFFDEMHRYIITVNDCQERITTHHKRFSLTHDRLIENLNQFALLVAAYHGLLDESYADQAGLLIQNIGSLVKQNGEALEDLGKDFKAVMNVTMELFGIETDDNNTLAK